MAIPEGYGFIPGPRSKERAQAVLAAAREAKVDVSTIQTDVGNNGYLAPTGVLDVLDASSAKAKKASTPQTSSIREIDPATGEPITVEPTDLDPTSETAALSVESTQTSGTVKKSSSRTAS